MTTYRGTRNNNHTKRHLSGTVLLGFNRPTLLITDAFNTLKDQVQKRADRDAALFGKYLVGVLAE